MYKVFVERTTDYDCTYVKETFSEAKSIADRQKKKYARRIKIVNTDNGEIVYRKELSADGNEWITEE